MQEVLDGTASANFFEGMGCPGGCVGGPKRVIPTEQGRKNVADYGEEDGERIRVESLYRPSAGNHGGNRRGQMRDQLAVNFADHPDPDRAATASHAGGVGEAVKSTVERLNPHRKVEVRVRSADGVPSCRQMMQEVLDGSLLFIFARSQGN
mgnify:CR=1 FL=1